MHCTAPGTAVVACGRVWIGLWAVVRADVCVCLGPSDAGSAKCRRALSQMGGGL
jgi:hypothetical protein